MNTAARGESANKSLKTTLLVSSEARELSTLEIFRPMGRIVLSGRATPVEVWEPAPQMDAELRATLVKLWERFDGGDTSALPELEQIANSHTEDAALEIGRAHVCTPVTNAHLVCRHLLEKNKHNDFRS